MTETAGILFYEPLEDSYRHLETRERLLLSQRMPLTGGEVLSVGCGWHPGRHLFPALDPSASGAVPERQIRRECLPGTLRDACTPQ